jgi:hypothetical protein
VSPRLLIQAEDSSCGKTITLNAVSCLVPNQLAAASLSAASVFRTISAAKPTLCLDEADQILKYGHANPELVAVLNATHYRPTAFVLRCEQLPDGSIEVVKFPVWCSMALASIKELPRTQQERGIVLHLDKALVEEVKERLRHGTSPELVMLRRRLATWAAALTELPEFRIPEVLLKQAGRVADNWEPLLLVAELAGASWCERAREALEASIGVESSPSEIQRLLLSIRRAFTVDDTTGFLRDEPIAALVVEDLLGILNEDPEEEWGTANRRKPVTGKWLANRLRGLIDTTLERRWNVMIGGVRRTVRGYRLEHFTKAWMVHLASIPDDRERNPDVPRPQPEREKGVAHEEHFTSYPPIQASHPSHPTQPLILNDNREQHVSQHSSQDGYIRHSSPATDGGAGSAQGVETAPNGPTSAAVTDGEGGVTDAVTNKNPNPSTKSKVVTGGTGVTHAKGGRRKRYLMMGPIEELLKEHPDWTSEKIAKQLGQPKVVIEKVLELLQ